MTGFSVSCTGLICFCRFKVSATRWGNSTCGVDDVAARRKLGTAPDAKNILHSLFCQETWKPENLPESERICLCHTDTQLRLSWPVTLTQLNLIHFWQVGKVSFSFACMHSDPHMDKILSQFASCCLYWALLFLIPGSTSIMENVWSHNYRWKWAFRI